MVQYFGLVPDDDGHELFARWLANEKDSAVVDAVDGGVYGRPVTVEGVRKAYITAYPKRFNASEFPWRSGTLLSTQSYYAAVVEEGGSANVRHNNNNNNNDSSGGAQPLLAGHIDCLTVESTSTCPAETCGWIFMVYMLAQYRSMGIGKAMVQAACETFPIGTPVRLTVSRTNPRAKAFYETVGFQVVQEHTLPGGYLVDMMERIM